MKKQLKKKNVYDDDDFDYPPYIPPQYSHPFPATRPSQQQQQQQQQQEEEEETPANNKPKYCFL